MSLWESVCVSLDFRRVRNTLVDVFFTLRPIDVIVHRHEDGSIFRFLKFDSVVCHLPLNLVEQIQCGPSIDFQPPSDEGKDMKDHIMRNRC